MTEVAHALRAHLARGKTPTQAVAAALPATASTRELIARVRSVQANIAGPGRVLEQLLNEPDVTDILINATSVWVERGGRLERYDVDIGSEGQVRALAVRLAAAGGVRLDEAKPIVDGRLTNGTRFHAVLSPPAVGGTLISLRTHRRQRLTLTELCDNGMIDGDARELIERLVAKRANTLISGATGSGKTTLLSAILTTVPATQRIITIEEVAELNPDHPHTVTLATREANVEGEGAVTLTDLVHAAMRMRPDRIVLGECRGPEVRDVLTAFNTGHDGGWSTIHANRASDVPARLVALGALAGMSESMVYAQGLAALDAIIHLGRQATGQRIVEEIAVIAREPPLRVLSVLREGTRGVGWSVLEGRLSDR
ncbi:MAG: TadA family conjugal transfer-associated ATPase [Actinomycetaceae bacterium]|nr:TadA family conjugal transfer-associated ATPase [Actinomycetaceae bacterium]